MYRFFVACLLLPAAAAAQAPLDGYVTEALQSNLVLQERQVGLERSLLALREARTYFLPSVALDGQYTLASGGRRIDLPVGDLMNPVYSTLNQLTGSNKFPQISNVSEQFLPNNFYDVKVRTTLPLVNPDIRTGQQIRSEQVRLQQFEIDTYRRELVKEVKTAYYRLLQAEQAVAIYRNAVELVQQNLKVQQSLLRNGKGLPAYVSRAESELKNVETELRNAEAEVLNAQAYINFLRNKPLTEPVQRTEPSLPPERTAQGALLPDVSKREELKSLTVAQAINQRQMQLARSFRTPRLNAFMDLGAQAFDFKVNRNAPYYLAGLQVQLPLFSGGRNRMKVQQAELDGRSLDIRTEQVRQQLQLAAYVGQNQLQASWHTYQAALKSEESAKQYFRLIERGYTEGVNSFIEFLDARNQLTNARLAANIRKYNLLIAAAAQERNEAGYALPESG